MSIPRAARDRTKVRDALRTLLEASGALIALDPVPTWREGPTLREVARSLETNVGLCNLVQQDYLGVQYRVDVHRRAPTLEVHRELDLATVVEAVLRLWAARGPLLELTDDDRQALAGIVETGATYPMQRTMARLLLEARPALGGDPAAIASAITEIGYEHLWNDAFSALT